jgi:hypothetical protein
MRNINKIKYGFKHFEQALSLLNGRLALADLPRYNLVICGGAALVARGLILRGTKDVDIVALMNEEGVLFDPEPLPKALIAAAQEVAEESGPVTGLA